MKISEALSFKQQPRTFKALKDARKPEPKLLDMKRSDAEFLDTDPSPNATISTGFDGPEAATELKIYYLPNRTLVVPEGEAHNVEPWVYVGLHHQTDVKRWYRAMMKSEGGLGDDY